MQWHFGARLSRLLTAYYFGPDHPAKQRLWRYAMTVLGWPGLVREVGDGGRLVLDMRDFIQFEALRDGAYEREVWDALARHAVSDEVVWDVGAHVGTFAVRAALDTRVASVHAFEPNPKTFPALLRNRRLNASLALEVSDAALGDDDGVRKLYLGLPANRGLSGFTAQWSSESTEVRVQRGDTLVKEGLAPPPTLLKLDVEGAEQAVLRGMETLLRRSPPKAIVFEGTTRGERAEETTAIVDFLADCGFAVTPFKYEEDRETRNWLALPR